MRPPGQGLEGDITVVEGVPAQDIRALGRVRYVRRAGTVSHAKRS